MVFGKLFGSLKAAVTSGKEFPAPCVMGEESIMVRFCVFFSCGGIPARW